MPIGEKKTVIEVSWKELEALAAEKYGLADYSFAEAEECGNDSQHTFSVEPAFDQAGWDESVAKHFLYCNYILLNRLCHDGHIEQGDYLVTVSW